MRQLSVWSWMALFMVIACDHGGHGVPAGMVGMFDRECPEGWSRYTPLDGRFPLGAEQPGELGGKDQHAHAFDITAKTSKEGEHVHMLAKGEPVEVDTGFYGNIGIHKGYIQAFEEGGHPGARQQAMRAKAVTDKDGLHDHLISVQGDTDSVSSMPPFITVIYCRKD